MSEKWTVEGPTAIEVGAPDDRVREVRVRLIGGRVDVVATDDADGGAVVEVTSVRGRPLDVTWNGGVLEVAHPQLGWASLLDWIRPTPDREGAAEVSIAVPRDVEVTLGTVTADGLLSGTRGDAEVKTVSATLVLDGVRGSVTAKTVSGQIDVRDHEGSFHGGSVSGSLTVHARSAPRLHAKTVSGDVGVDLLASPSVLDVTTVSGDVTVRIPEDTGYEVSAKSVSGRVVAGTDRLDARPGDRGGRLVAGDGAVRLVAKTVSGDVTLLRASSS